MEVWYNRQRRHSALNYQSPVAFEEDVLLLSSLGAWHYTVRANGTISVDDEEGAMRGKFEDVEVVALLAFLGWVHVAVWAALQRGHAPAGHEWGGMLLGPALAWLLGRAVWRRWRGRGEG